MVEQILDHGACLRDSHGRGVETRDPTDRGEPRFLLAEALEVAEADEMQQFTHEPFGVADMRRDRVVAGCGRTRRRVVGASLDSGRALIDEDLSIYAVVVVVARILLDDDELLS